VTDNHGNPEELSIDAMLDDISLYWFTIPPRRRPARLGEHSAPACGLPVDLIELPRRRRSFRTKSSAARSGLEALWPNLPY
jgi:hypothetical protein